MGSLITVLDNVDGTTLVAGRALAIIMAMPLVGIILTKAYPAFRSMPAAEAVVMFGAIGGLSGLISQKIAASQLSDLSRGVNVLELTPAIAASVLASAIVTWLLLPPNPNPVTVFLRQIGEIPS